MAYPQSELELKDLPLTITNNDDSITFQKYDKKVLQLRVKGESKVAPDADTSLEDARLTLKDYLNNGWDLK